MCIHLTLGPESVLRILYYTTVAIPHITFARVRVRVRVNLTLLTLTLTLISPTCLLHTIAD